MHPVFSIAVFELPTHRAFGLDLQPLTLGHLFLLRECRSKLLLPVKAGLGDVLLAAFICSTPHWKSRKNLGRRWRVTRFLASWGRAAKSFDLAEETQKFRAYLHECFECPQIAAEKSGGESAIREAPDEWCTLAMLMADFHLTRTEAYNTELAWASAVWAANFVRNGGKLKSCENSLGDEAAFRRSQELTHAKEVACSA